MAVIGLYEASAKPTVTVGGAWSTIDSAMSNRRALVNAVAASTER